MYRVMLFWEHISHCPFHNFCLWDRRPNDKSVRDNLKRIFRKRNELKNATQCTLNATLPVSCTKCQSNISNKALSESLHTVLLNIDFFQHPVYLKQKHVTQTFRCEISNFIFQVNLKTPCMSANKGQFSAFTSM